MVEGRIRIADHQATAPFSTHAGPLGAYPWLTPEHSQLSKLVDRAGIEPATS